MLDKLTALTGSADHIDAIARIGMYAMPIVALLILIGARIAQAV